ncbi:MAG: hypothetical protein ACQEP3_01980 [Patescibacteria group bacterium]
MRLNKTKTKKFFEKLALLLANKSIIVILFFILICLIIAFIIFNLYLTKVIEKEFVIDQETSTVNYQLYDEVINDWKSSETEIDNDLLRLEGDGENPEKEIEEGEEEEVVEEDNLSEEELESELADTLFELYEFTEGELPSLSERAIIWQDLGLGNSDNYRGTYSQNIELLKRLKEEL